MNIKKYTIIILFAILPTINLAQKTSELDCENGFESIETEVETQQTVSYKLISSRKLYTENSFEFSEGIIVISNLNEDLNIKEITKTIATIGVKNKLSKIFAFKSCEAVELYFQKSNLTSEQQEYLKNNLIGKVDIDINESLSKKDRKKNKSKRDLIELVSNQSCEEFKNLKTKKISAEQIGEIMAKYSSQNIKKTMKIYDMSFEESSMRFTEDVFNHIKIHCQVIKELTTE